MEKIASLLVEKGMMPTKQRLELLTQYLIKINISQHQTFSLKLKKLVDISQATVYNTLWLFEERNAKNQICITNVNSMTLICLLTIIFIILNLIQ